MRAKCFAFLAALMFTLEAAGALDCQNVRAAPNSAPTHVLVCRGPLTFNLQRTTGDASSGPAMWVRIPFERSGNAAGAAGALLNNGSCAWVDRAVSPGEPNTITFDVTDTRWVGGLGQPMSEMMFAELRNCGRDSNCRLHMCAASFDGTGTGFQDRFLVAGGARFEMTYGGASVGSIKAAPFAPPVLPPIPPMKPGVKTP